MSADYTKELEFAKGLAREAGEIMRRYFRADDIGTHWKDDGSPVTVADEKINELVITRVQEAFPGHGVHGEEGSVHEGREWMWICDPIDGTIPFSAGLPVSTFSLGLTREGVPQLGVVYDPFLDRLFEAIYGGPTKMNGTEVTVSSHNTLKGAYIDSDTWTARSDTDPFLPIFGLRERLLDVGAIPITPGGFVLTGCLVASGDLGGAIFALTKPEDLAAVKILVEQAGGKVTDLEGNDQRYDRPINGAIASNGLVHHELLRLVAESRE
jgi:fructose-1,6-bisphosphatase/inositol monophosphatase family enzyme